MKTRKFTKVVSFILALTILATTLLVNSFKVSAAVTPVETQCIRCDATLGCSGPYLGSVPTPNDSTFGGAYVVDSDRDEWHYYIIKCPDFKNTLLGKKHDNYPAVERHNYTSTYTQYDSSRHTRTYTCTKNNAAYNIVGTEGCGYSKDALEAHTVSWQRHSHAEDDYHLLQSMCICGYVVSEVKEPHTFEPEKTYNYSMTQHHKTKFCTVCQDTIHIYENHNLDIVSEWEPFGNTECKRILTCSDCNYQQEEIKNHNLATEWIFASAMECKKRSTCSDCGYFSEEIKAHKFTYSEWESKSSSEHTRTATCSECGYSATETVNHNNVTGEWFKYGSENPYDKEFYHTEYHQRNIVCSDCGNVVSEHAKHDWYWMNEIWEYKNEERHTRTKRCKDCDYGWIYTDYHHFKTEPYYEPLSKNEHTKINPCDECNYEKETLEAHSFTASTVYTQFSESHHQVTQSCICGEKHISYADHVDQNSDCYCDKCGYLMTKFSVTVPTTMVLTMGTDGEVYAPSDVVIINNSTAAVSVKKADINSRNGWNIVPYSTNMANEKVDSKKIGFKMNGIQTDSSGTTDSLSYNNSWIIEKDKSSAVVYDAVVSATSSPIDEQVIEVVFVVDWKE